MSEYMKDKMIRETVKAFCEAETGSEVSELVFGQLMDLLFG